MCIPILVMTRNEGKFLERCVRSIQETVTTEYKIYIVDNASNDPEHLDILDKLESKLGVCVIRNKHNLWVLGLNSLLRKLKKESNSKYFFLTDGDIDFSNCMKGECWLNYLVSLMNRNISIGKLGISLSWDYLEKTPDLVNILEQEKLLYNNSKKINELYVSPVDTTATLFRFDWSVEASSLFYPDHMRYLRPELYSCRTSRDVLVEHLGWLNYKNNNIPRNLINQKVMCFTLVGGYIKKEVLETASLKYKVFNKLFGRLIFRLWVIRRLLKTNIYSLIRSRKGFDGHFM